MNVTKIAAVNSTVHLPHLLSNFGEFLYKTPAHNNVKTLARFVKIVSGKATLLLMA